MVTKLDRSFPLNAELRSASMDAVLERPWDLAQGRWVVVDLSSMSFAMQGDNPSELSEEAERAGLRLFSVKCLDHERQKLAGFDTFRL